MVLLPSKKFGKNTGYIKGVVIARKMFILFNQCTSFQIISMGLVLKAWHQKEHLLNLT